MWYVKKEEKATRFERMCDLTGFLKINKNKKKVSGSIYFVSLCKCKSQSIISKFDKDFTMHQITMLHAKVKRPSPI